MGASEDKELRLAGYVQGFCRNLALLGGKDLTYPRAEVARKRRGATEKHNDRRILRTWRLAAFMEGRRILGA